MAKKPTDPTEPTTAPLAPPETLADINPRVEINGEDAGPLELVEDGGPDDDADDVEEQPTRRRNIVFRGHGNPPNDMAILVGDKPVRVRLRHDEARQREGFYHRYAKNIIADVRDTKGRRVYKEFREDKGA